MLLCTPLASSLSLFRHCNISSMSKQTSLTCSLMLNVLCCFNICLSQALDTLRPGQDLYYDETLVSAAGVFELGFFASGENSDQYLGIWFKNDKTKKPVWVANRDNPIYLSGALSIRYDGNLVISDARLSTIIVNYGMLTTTNNTIAKLSDSGNLVLLDGEKIVWQSFDYPTDTFLPGMKVGWFNVGTNQERKQFLSSWLSPSVPSRGSFLLGLDAENRTRFLVWNKGVVQRIVGYWDGHDFIFFFKSSSADLNFSFVSNGIDVYFTSNSTGNNVSSWFVLASNGDINEFKMTETEISMVTHSLCEGINSNDCLPTPSMCSVGDTFSEIRGSIPNSTTTNGSIPVGPSECEILCRSYCQCTAFASFNDICELYYGNKRDLLNIGEGDITINVRGDAPTSSGQKRIRRLWWIITVPVIILFILIASYYLLWRKFNFKDFVAVLSLQSGTDATAASLQLSADKDHELPLLTFSCLAISTDNFSDTNKLGEGGFGPVYKGKLSGHDIAVKRLSKSSGQGLEEFKNEVQLISKLQHRNLVKILGCCIQQKEKILIYEYMPNKSLDSFIFEPKKQTVLDWRRRLHIIEGIAQGLLYLHKYSRLKIIHRDLKTSNILLDSYMNPKISDFGLARIFYDNESRAKTKRIAGTYGYMSPEYAVHGIFSTKSDVFSFGVILLEIVSGKSINCCKSNSSLNWLGHVWELWLAGRCIELMDPTLAASCSMNELVLCIQVGLLCVQDNAQDRPTMSDVVSMLSNKGAFLPTPKQPAFFFSTNLGLTNVDSPEKWQKASLNFVTFSAVEGR